MSGADAGVVKLEQSEKIMDEDKPDMLPTTSESVQDVATKEKTIYPETSRAEQGKEDTITPTPTPSPHRTRSKPKKGILKPPRPPVKPGLGGKLRDALGSIHPKFLDYAAPGANGQVAAAAHGIAAGPVGNIANGVIEGAGVIGGAVGGAAAAVVGTWGGKLGRFVSGATNSSLGSQATGNQGGPSIQLPWKLQTAGTSSPNQERSMNTNGSARPESALSNQLSALSVSLGSAQTPLPLDSHKPLKRASFLLPLISITYPISSTNPPWSDKILADRDEIERTKNEEVVAITAKEYWTRGKLVALYETACKAREELIRKGVVSGLTQATGDAPTPRQLLLTYHSPVPPGYFLVDPPLNKHSAEALSDVLSLEWGLTRLALEGGVIDHDDSLKPILHALLMAGTLPHLSIAGNRKIKSPGWRMVAAYVRKAKSLRFLDLSDNLIDKRSADYLAQAFLDFASDLSGESTIPDEEKEKGSGQLGRRGFNLRRASSLSETRARSIGLQTLRLDGCSLRPASLDAISYSLRRSNLKNLSMRRNRINASGAVAIALIIRDYPDNRPTTATVNNGSVSHGDALFSRLNQDFARVGTPDLTEGSRDFPIPPTHPSLTLEAEPEKLGPLVTLDIKGNEIRSGVSYIAQVLKRNKTLKVLNLSDNKIDAAGLQTLAQALKFNTTLETLDLSHNPCCGPILDGVIALKSALAVNTSLKRLYLGSTGMTTDGAVIVAEGLHEARHILHIDLTDNPAIGSDGASALSVGIRANSTIRCLDLTMDHSDPAQAELAQSLMQCCIRNTEAAIEARDGKISDGIRDAMWAPIRESALVRQAKEYDEQRNMEAVRKTIDTPAGLARSEVYTLKPGAVLKATEEVAQYLRGFNTKHKDAPLDSTEQQRAVGAVEQAKALLERVGDLIQETEDPERMERLLAANDMVTPLVVDAQIILAASQKRKVIQLQTKPTINVGVTTAGPTRPVAMPARRHMRMPSHELSSPNFSLTNSDDDDDSDAEEVAEPSIVQQPQPKAQATLAGTGTLPFIKKKKPIALAGLQLGAFNVQVQRDTATGSDDQTGLAEDHASMEPLPSPLERVNKDWLEEEGEIFRKGFKLGVAEEIEEREDKAESGNVLKQKILETNVARTPHRPIQHQVDEDDSTTDDDE